MTLRLRFAVPALAACLLSGAAHAQPLFCPDSELNEIRRQEPLPALLGIIPPIVFLHALGRDRMADLPRRPVAFRVVDERGQTVPNALVGIIHRKEKRFLAEGSGGGAPIALPHGGYVVNAAIVDKDRVVRFGSTEVTIDAKGPATVTVKLTGRADPAVPKSLVATAPVGTAVSTDFESALRQSAVLAVVRQGANLRASSKDDAPVVLGQYEIKEPGAREFLLPGKVGQYDVVAMLCAPRVPLARWAIAITPVQIAISAPDRVPIGSVVDATLSGGINSAARATFAKQNRDVGDTQELTDKQKVGFNAGYEPGQYQIIVAAHDGTVLARRPVTVERREIAISGPDTVALGSKPEFTWPGSGGASLEIWSLANGKASARKISDVSENRLLAPAGMFELRLVRPGVDGANIVARKKVRIEGQAFVDAPTEVTSGSRISVKLALDAEFFDELNFYKSGSKSDYEMSSNSSRDPRVMEVRAPDKPGKYDLVFKLGSVHEKIEVARVPVVVRP